MAFAARRKAGRQMSTVSGGPAVLGATLEALAEEYKGIWRYGTEQTLDLDEVLPHDLLEDCPEPPRPADVLKAAGQFKERTATGIDGINPSSFGHLSAGGLEALCLILHWVEYLVRVPSQVEEVFIFFLAKPDGGWRPIGLLCGLIRLLGRLRHEEAREWERQHHRSFFYGGAGRSCEDAVWAQAFDAEHSKSIGLDSLSSMLDLGKAYERVTHRGLVAACRRHGSPLRRLKLLLSVYGGRRRLCVGRWKTDAIKVGLSIIAGCGFATSLLRVVLLSPLDALLRCWGSLKLYVAVDDLTLAAHGRLRDIELAISKGTDSLCVELERLGLEISLTKGNVISSNLGAGQRVTRKLSRWGFQLHHSVRNLGVDFGMGKTASWGVLRSRLKKLGSRASRFMALRNAGAKLGKVFRVGGVASVLHGARVRGVPAKALQQARTVNARAIAGKAGPRSRTLQFALQEGDGWKRDPAYACDSMPLLAWSKAVYTKLRLPAAFKAAHGKGPPASWGGVNGPTAAVFLTLRRLGWSFAAWNRWTTDEGQELDLSDLSPRYVASVIEGGTTWILMKRVAAHPGFESLGGRPPDLQPLRAGLAALRRSSDKETVSLVESLVAGGMVTQSDLYRESLAGRPQVPAVPRGPRHLAPRALQLRRDLPAGLQRWPPVGS